MTPPSPRPFRYRLLRAAALAGMSLALLLVTLFFAVRQAHRQLRTELLQQARIVAMAIHPSWAGSLEGSDNDLANSRYLRLKEQITTIRTANPRIRFVSLMGQNESGQALVLVDSEPESSEDYSPPGQVYDEASETMLATFASGQETVTRPEKDRWGTWISAFVPLHGVRLHGHPVLAALDIDAATWHWLVARQAALPVALAAIAILLALGLVLLQQNRRALRARQAELAASQQRYDTIAAQSRTIVWEIDPQGLYTYVSPAVEPIMGYRPDDLMDKVHFYDLHPEDSRDAFRQSVFQAFDRQETFTNLENPVLARDGRVVWISTSAIPLRDPRGALRGYRGSGIDITERKTAQLALQSSEAQKQAILDNIPLRVALLDKNLNILWANKAAAESAGKPPADLVGVPCHQIWGEPLCPCDNCPAVAAIRSRTGSHDIVRAPDGRLWDEHAEPLFDADGRLCAIVEVAEDITTRRASEEQIRRLLAEGNQARQALLSILEDVKQTGHELRRQTHAQRLLIQISSSFINRPLESVEDAIQEALQSLAQFSQADRAYIFDYDFDRQTCRNTHEWCAPGIEPEIDTLQNVPLSQMPDWVEAHRAGRPIYIPKVLAMPPGVARDILHSQGIQSLIAVPILEAGRSIGFIGFDSIRQTYVYSEHELGLLRIFAELLVNIRMRKRVEEDQIQLESRLMQSQKMDSIGRLAGGVAHDFNNMLTVILGRVEMALDQAARQPPLLANLEEIRKVAENSISLTQQLLAFARKQISAPRPLDLNRTVSHMVQLLQRLIGENIELGWRLAADLWPIKADPAQIEQVLTNLCVNARDAIAGHGHITIETANVAFAESPPGHVEILDREFVRLSVRDDGCGMDPDILGHLFEPFFTTKAPGKGTGLGLAMVYGIIKQHNGFIDIESTPGSGSLFHLYWPRHAGTLESPAPSPVPAGPLQPGHETVLLVEDNPNILELAGELLAGLGYTVLPARTPDDALRLAREHNGDIHLLLTDVVMPEMNGRDLAEEIRAHRPRIVTLFTSGYTADVIAHNNVLDDGVHFLQKPFTRDTLGTKIRQALDA